MNNQILNEAVDRLKNEFAFGKTDNKAVAIIVNIAEQKLYLIHSDKTIVKSYPVSTSRFGIGNLNGSKMTPPGIHKINKKIKSNNGLKYYSKNGLIVKECEYFIGRIPKGMTEIYTSIPQNYKKEGYKEYITGAILWLEGLEKGLNKGGNVDTLNRYIYIHGTNEEFSMGTPGSIGCVRMSNKDIFELYDMVETGTLVIII